ncbi:MAG: hypothetical protein ABWJ42_03405 [Sulfolobales archaeon]
MRGSIYKKEFWRRWYYSDIVTRESMIRDLLTKSLLHRESSPDLLAYVMNTYLEDLAEFLCNEICENKCLSNVKEDQEVSGDK